VKKKLLFLSRILITFILVVVVWLFLRDNADELWQTLKSANKGLMLLGFILFTMNIFVLAWRLKYVLKTQHLDMPLKKSIIINFIGFFFNSFLPTAVGGDIARGYYVSQMNNKKKLECYTAVIADRTIGLISIAFIAIIALFFARSDLILLKTRLIIMAVFLLSVFLIVFALNDKLASKFSFLIKIIKFLKLEESARRIYKVLNDFQHFKRESCAAFFIAFSGQLLMITVAYIIAQSLKMNLSYMVFLLFMPIVSAASMIPSLGGTGPREGAFILLFGPISSDADAGALTLIWLTYFVVLSMLGGIVYLVSGYHKLSISEIEEIEIDYDK
jgi:hypothetical protein